MKVADIFDKSHNPFDETCWVSCLRENLTISSYGEGLETGRNCRVPRQSLTRQLFFRWLKCILACRHWLGESLNALTLQVYAGLIASLLLTIWTNRRPNKRTFEMVCHFFSGWASEQELQRHLNQSIKQPAGP